MKGTDFEVAIKTINIKNAKQNHMSIDQIVNECNILNSIKSPFVMKLVEYKVEGDHLFIICE